ncbi:Putative PRAME family member 25 [Cricetulus griseus]|uniref:Putative PRAME family member 25 n=1 Tax=Cricetulus griseus TaxID=10029 RepID=G3ICA5_CRIGR|nr:Putative PRAME family member 25 [Cricetulus griseus]
MLFLALFQEAFSHRLPNIVRAMMAAWPFPYIPVGTLLTSGTLEFSQVVVEGLRALLTQQDRPVTGNVRILDFRRVAHEIWTVEAKTEDGDCSTETVSEKQAVKPPPRYEQRQRLKVITDLYSRFQQEEEETDLLPGAQHRKDSLQLCCVNMKIVLLSEDHVIMFRQIFRLWDIEMLEFTLDWNWSSLLRFYPYLAHMKNLHTLSLVWMDKNTYEHAYTSEYKWFVRAFISELSKISSLQHLYMNGICFLSDNMRHLLSQCSKLSKVNFYTNDFSMTVLSDLLHYTANLSKITMEQYPAPQECYELGVVSKERFVQFCPVLMDTLRAIRQPKRVYFATDVCNRCSKRCVYEEETRLCSCLQ